VIDTQGMKLPATLGFSFHLDMFDGRWSAILGGQEHHPHISAEIIYQE
jgi:hypothetical protein